MSKVQQTQQRADDYGVTAQHYDLVYADYSAQDEQFYLDIAKEHSGPILELGCGTGRISLPLARAGHRVVGLDLSPAMLAVFEHKLAQESPGVRELVRLAQGDMASLDMGEQFGLILAPFRAYQHLIEPAAQRSCLERIAAHLKPDGRFVYNAFEPNIDYLVRNRQLGPVWQLDHDVATPDGGLLLRYHTVQPEYPRQVNLVRFKYEVYDATGKLAETAIEKFEMRWQTRYEARYLLELCGLQVEAAYGGYDRRPMDERLGELIFVCKRA